MTASFQLEGRFESIYDTYLNRRVHLRMTFELSRPVSIII